MWDYAKENNTNFEYPNLELCSHTIVAEVSFSVNFLKISLIAKGFASRQFGTSDVMQCH